MLAARATNRPGASVNPAGLLVRLIVETEDGGPDTSPEEGTYELVTGPGWRVSATEPQEGWQRPAFDDADWTEAAVLAPYRQGPWGSGVTVAVPEQPAPLLRRAFTVRRRISRARLYISGLAYYEAEINGRRVGRQVLEPGFTDYDETVLYAVHDVTESLRRGKNVIGVTLGRGFFGMTTANVWNWHRPPWHGEPRLLAQLEIDHPDGSRTTVASGCCAPTAALTWQTPSRHSGPIRAGGTGRPTAPTPCGRCGRWTPAPATTTSWARSRSGYTRTWPGCVPGIPATAPSRCAQTPVRESTTRP